MGNLAEKDSKVATNCVGEPGLCVDKPDLYVEDPGISVEDLVFL